jgi:lysophospholipase L1-like esterase
MPRSRRVALVLVSLVGSLFAAELALRIFHYKPEPAMAFLLTHPTRVPDRTITSIDRKFLRDDYYAVDKRKRTIVTLGDSFTEGFPTEESQHYPNVLRALLREAGCDVNVLNLGLGASGTDQQLALFEREVLPRLMPDVVVWALYQNDVLDNTHMAAYTVAGGQLVALGGPPSWLYTRQKFYDAFPARIRQSSYLFNLVIKAFETIAYRQVPSEFRDDPDAWGLKKIPLAVNEMTRLSKLHGFTLVVVVIRPEADYLADNDPQWLGDRASLRYRHIKAALSSDFVDARFDESDIFAGAEIDPNRLGDHHFNTRGYRLLAQKVFERVRCP